jgi:hypothetical protein
MSEDTLPLKPPPDPPHTAPAWVALVTLWLGLLTLVSAIVFPFLPGSQNPRAELEHFTEYSVADKFVPVPIYATSITIFLGVIVLWQMRKQPNPLPDPLLIQRVQAKFGIFLALLAAGIVYLVVALRGPTAG